MDRGHELAFINQNFQSIANVLQQNSFVIVGTGTTTVTAMVNQGSFNLVTHNLGYVPMVIATCQGPSTSFLFSPNWAMVPYIVTSESAVTKTVVTIPTINTTSLQFEVDLGSGATGAAGVWTFNYKLLQQTAN